MSAHSAWASILALSLASIAHPVGAQSPATAAELVVRADQPGPAISRDIFGQFAEQLGEGIYGGVWVGPQSPIPNVRGIRKDVVSALRALKVPNVRWPGGCFADSYHWRDGIGKAEQRPATYNINWGSPLETNKFGTHEFMDFVQQIGSEGYISVNVGSGTVREAAEWLEYMTSDQPTSLTSERVANGREQPYRVKFLGIGNEVWACGGNLSAESYIERLKSFGLYVRNLNPKQSGPTRFMRGPDPMQRIAVGPGDDNPEYTEAIMRAWKAEPSVRQAMDGLSLHHYTMGEHGAMRDPATGFGEKEYATFIRNAYVMDKLVDDMAATMDRYDPEKKVAIVVDEWGAWLQPMPGTPMLNIKQQNSLRDAIIASLHLNIFARHADRVRMTNIAQMVNVLQSMILTDGPKMVLTPTYYVYRMYVPFQDAKLLPVRVEAGRYRFEDIDVAKVDAVAARAKDGQVWLALTNIDPERPAQIDVETAGVKARQAEGEVLTAANVDAVNAFDKVPAVAPRPIAFRPDGTRLMLELPPKSLTVVRLVE